MVNNNLVALRKRAGLTQPDVADDMKVSVPQVSRWENGKDNIPSGRLPEMARAYQATVGEIFADQVPLGPTLNVKGEVAGGVWREAVEWPEEDWKTFTGRSDVTVRIEGRFGLRVVGESMNIPYPNGTIVECVKLLEGGELVSGKRVIVLRRNIDGEHEATVKEYEVDAQGVPWLWPRSTHPDFQQPWRLDEPQPGIVYIEIVAVVVASTRLE